MKQDMILSLKASLTARRLLLDTGWLSDGAQNAMQGKAEQTARLLGKSQSAVANKLRILRHSPKVLTALRDGGLSERHARALLRLATDPEKMMAISTIVREGMSVARAERYIDQLLLRQQEEPRAVNVGAFLSSLNQSLARIQRSGIGAVSERRETEDEIVLTITIPK